MSVSHTRRSGTRSDAATHEGFLRHRRFRWLRVAVVFGVVAILGYLFADVRPRPGGGTWYGYTLGVASAALILWLTLIGIRKRAMTPGRWSLKAWVSAHVYLGLSLLVVATLHTGFSFHWNVHTLAYGLMLLVIASGIFGVIVYATLPARLSENRREMTQRQMLEALKSLDLQLDLAAQPLRPAESDIVRLSLEHTDIAGGFWARITGAHPRCGNALAIRRLLRLRQGGGLESDAAALAQIATLLDRKAASLRQARIHIRLQTIMEVWLKVHVPTTFALLAALTAHIVSVFFYW